MSAVSYETAMELAKAYREIEVAEELLVKVRDQLSRMPSTDIRDGFGHRTQSLQLGVPHGDNGHMLFNVSWKLAAPVIAAHIAELRAIIASLSEKALAEARLTSPLGGFDASLADRASGTIGAEKATRAMSEWQEVGAAQSGDPGEGSSQP